MTSTASLPSTADSPSTGSARQQVRGPHLAVGVLLLAGAIAVAAAASTGAGPVLLFAVLPDLALLGAIGASHERGQLPARAVPLYNLLHHPLVPALFLAAVVLGVLGAYWVVAALAWGAHIALDRGLGYGLRTPDGWQRA
jgi:hypothetical protein